MENIYINMPISTDTIIVCAGLLVLTIVAMMFGSSGLVPSYGFENKSLQGHPYEGFAQAMDYFYNRDDTEGFAPLGYSEYGAVPASEPKKVTGFDGVQGDATVEHSGLMGYLGMNPARTDCKDYGYTKSTGKVCFSPADVQLLTTRGGNAR
jgi:hypothetical protein